jgi:hypothetical protein
MIKKILICICIGGGAYLVSSIFTQKPNNEFKLFSGNCISFFDGPLNEDWKLSADGLLVLQTSGISKSNMGVNRTFRFNNIPERDSKINYKICHE